MIFTLSVFLSPVDLGNGEAHRDIGLPGLEEKGARRVFGNDAEVDRLNHGRAVEIILVALKHYFFSDFPFLKLNAPVPVGCFDMSFP